VSNNIRLYPWFQFFRNLHFWQSNWFLIFQHELSAAEAISLFAVFDIGTILSEVPSGYMSDRIGRRLSGAVCHRH
jgi:MFS family permease